MKDLEQLIVAIRAMIPRAVDETERQYLSKLADDGKAALEALKGKR